MRIILGIAAFLHVVLAQSINETYLAGLGKALNDSGLIELSTIAVGISDTTDGARLLNILPTKNFTIFAPDDDAFDQIPDSIGNNATLLGDILSYHVVYGNLTGATATYPNVTVGRTLLNDSAYVSLEGNKSQVLVWTHDSENDTNVVLNQATNVTVLKTVTYENLVLYVIDGVLEFPGLLSTVLMTQNLTTLKTILSSIDVQFTNNSSTTLMSALDNAKGFTLFAPSDSALALAASTISSLPNKTVEGTVLANHFVNGSTIYSPSISSSSNLTSAAGEPLSFMTNTTGVYVVSGNSVVKIVKTDVLTKNGVVHIIDGVLVNTQINTAAASSAFASATSVAAKSSSETGAIGTSTPLPSTSGGFGLIVSSEGGLVGALIAVGGALAGELLM